ncbi:MAG: hypothetical protein IJM62_03075 [Lachnospiraceae bacterium]|nr:hypothetical protein [Lachnospiraceae bacterium]
MKDIRKILQENRIKKEREAQGKADGELLSADDVPGSGPEADADGAEKSADEASEEKDSGNGSANDGTESKAAALKAAISKASLSKNSSKDAAGDKADAGDPDTGDKAASADAADGSDSPGSEAAGEEKPAEKKPSLYKRFLGLDRNTRIIIGAGLVTLLIILIYGIISLNAGYVNYTVVREVEKTDALAVNYQTTDNGLIRYNKDGASFTRDLENIVWNQSYEMASAKVVFCGEYMAIGDISSNSIRIFNEDGQQGVISTMYPIEDLCVARQGVVYAVMSDGRACYINAYSKEGEELTAIKATIEKTGYPQRIAVSEDGTKLAVGYLKTENGQIMTDLKFYHFGEAGKNQVDNIIGDYRYDELTGSLKFTGSDTVTAVFEKSMRIYSVRNSAEETASATFLSEIKSIFSNDRYSGFIFSNYERVLEDDDEDAQRSGAPWRVIVYTTSGSIYSDFTVDFNYNTVLCSDQEIIMYNDNACAIYDFRGKKRFEHTFNEQLLQMLPLENAGEYIIVTSSKVEEIRLN